MQDIKTNLPDDSNLTVARSVALENQFGVITKKEFGKGAVIFSVKGPILSEPTMYSLSAGTNKHIDPLRKDGSFDFGHYLNHSCEPNVIIKIAGSENSVPYIEIVARRDIKAGEELAFDYASSEYDTVSKTSCMCKAAICRGTIHGFKNLPSDIREKYEKEGMIPDYLL
jgi:hypothetical protein